MKKLLLAGAVAALLSTGAFADNLVVSNLSYETTEEDLKDVFGQYGQVYSARIITDRVTGRSKGFGFVEMPDGAAQEAINALHGEELNGRNLTVQEARPR